MFFGIFTTFRKLVVIKLIFAIETQTVYQMKFLSKKRRILLLNFSFFEGCVEKQTLSVLKGLSPYALQPPY